MTYTNDYTKKTYVQPGQRVQILCPHSEVCMHMKVAGKLMWAKVNHSQPTCPKCKAKDNRVYLAQDYGDICCEYCAIRWQPPHDPYVYISAQLFREDKDGTEYSGPITTGEAGFYQNDGGFYYYPPIEAKPKPPVLTTVTPDDAARLLGYSSREEAVNELETRDEPPVNPLYSYPPLEEGEANSEWEEEDEDVPF